MARAARCGHAVPVSPSDAAEVRLRDWTAEQRDSLEFLLSDEGIEWSWASDDTIIVSGAVLERVRQLVAYLESPAPVPGTEPGHRSEDELDDWEPDGPIADGT